MSNYIPGEHVRPLLNSIDTAKIQPGHPDYPVVIGAVNMLRGYLELAQTHFPEQLAETVVVEKDPFDPEEARLPEGHPYMHAYTILFEIMSKSKLLRRYHYDPENLKHKAIVESLRAPSLPVDSNETPLSVLFPDDASLYQLYPHILKHFRVWDNEKPGHIAPKKLQTIEALAALRLTDIHSSTYFKQGTEKFKIVAAIRDLAVEYVALDQGYLMRAE